MLEHQDPVIVQTVWALEQLIQNKPLTREDLFPGVATKEFPEVTANLVLSGLEKRKLISSRRASQGTVYRLTPGSFDEVELLTINPEELLELTRPSFPVLPPLVMTLPVIDKPLEEAVAEQHPEEHPVVEQAPPQKLERVTADTAPRSLPELVQLGRYQLRSLAKEIKMLEGDQQRMSFSALPVDKQAAEILRTLEGLDQETDEGTEPQGEQLDPDTIQALLETGSESLRIITAVAENMIYLRDTLLPRRFRKIEKEQTQQREILEGIEESIQLILERLPPPSKRR